ncbi:MAG: TonB-dependent receptor [Deltaproteobacteria bacterium]|jgi:outer membrane receptor protein involved in Fe transport|nr:TonB-dependent receptor [Deltaproteobacteria bacterium]
MKRFFILTVLLGLMVYPFVALSPALAQQDGSLRTIVVTDAPTSFNNPPMTLEEKAESTNRIVYDSVQLENSHSEVLSDFLAEQGIGMFKMEPNDHGHTQISIRGFRSDHLSKELDGRVTLLINGHRTGTANAAQIPLVNVERIEILRGAEMLKYTAASSGGVINVVTRKGGPDKLSAQVEVGVGSFNTYKTQAKFNGLINGFDYSLGYTWNKKGDYEDGRGVKVLHTGVKSNNAFMGEIGYRFNEQNRISWSTYYYKVDKAERPLYVDPTDPDEFFWTTDTSADRYNISNTFAYNGGTEDKRWAWDVSYTFGENLNKVYSVGPNAPFYYPMASKFDRQLLQGSLTYEGDFFTVTGGVDYLDYDTYEGVATRVTGATVVEMGRPLADTGKFKNLAGYLLANVRLLDEKLIFTGALRYDYYKVQDKRIDPQDISCQQGGGCPQYFGQSQWPTSQSYNHLSPSIGVSYLPLEYLKFRVNWTHGFRVPSPRELFSGWYEAYNFWGFPWNKGENSDTYEVGFDVNDKFVNLSATYFYTKTKDYIYQHQDPYQDHMRVRNSDRQKRSGIEVQFSANLAGAMGYDSFELRPFINFAYLFEVKELYRRGGAGNNGRWLYAYGQWMPRSSIGAGLRFRYPRYKFSANLNVNYTGKIYPGSDSSTNYPAFTVVNLSLRKSLIDFEDKGDLELKLDVANLFDRAYVYGNPKANPTYYLPGRSFYAGLVYNF